MTDAPDRQRIDKWLWHARVVRTRSAAAALAAGGHVRVNGVRIDAASRAVRRGDVVTVALDRRVRVLTVTGFAERRGSADDTVGLYEEQGSAADPSGATPEPSVDRGPQRDPGAGRPTKRDRRSLDRLRDDEP
ncbi:MAG: RNA-binding S4 domain-containing protein [Rhodovulum sp.]|nr:RNA-binding S4 domain-containing protein [Rhodovulum sp.]